MKTFASLTANESQDSHIEKYNVNRFGSSERDKFEVFCKKGVLKNFAKFSGKHLCQSLFSNKVADLRPATLLILLSPQLEHTVKSQSSFKPP